MGDSQHRYLVIDDDPGDIEILRLLLDDATAGQAEVAAFTEAGQALAELNSKEFTIIFVDYRLGEQTGLDLFKAIRNMGCDRPVVLLTGQGSESLAVTAMKAGVADYIIKEDLNQNTIERVVANALAKFELEQQVKEQQERLAKKVQELEASLMKVKLLSGMLPIFTLCKNIRDDKGYWKKSKSTSLSTPA